MQFPNATKRITPCSNWCECEWLNPYFYDSGHKFWIQPSDWSVQAGFPRKIGQNMRWVSETHGYHNVIYTVAYAFHMYGISVLSRDSIRGMRYANRTKNGKHVYTWTWFYMCHCVCNKTDDRIQNFMTWYAYFPKKNRWEWYPKHMDTTISHTHAAYMEAQL
jgi:hypothetical protein